MPAKKNIKAAVYGFVEGVMNEDHQKVKSVSGQINVQLSFEIGKKMAGCSGGNSGCNFY